MEELIETGSRILATYGLQVVGGFVILVLGFVVSGWVARGLRRSLTRVKRIDQTVASFFASLARYAIIAFTLFAVLDQFGVETTSLLAVFGAAGLAVGLALQGTLSNMAAGVMMMLFRPFKVGDFIETGAATGTVRNLTLFTTELSTPDNIHIVAPNGRIWGDTIRNYSHHPVRRLDFTLGIGYGDSIERAMEVIHATAAADTRVHAEPAPQVVVGALSDSSVDIIVRVWCDAGDFWPLRFDLNRAFKEAFDAAGVSIPFPQRDVHLHQAAQ